MFKVIVIDDELIARKTIRKYFEAYASDFEIILGFSNGCSALEYLKGNDVDVVFVDIKMHGVSGLDVAKWVAENKPHIKVVIVSGYSEFEYAQQAIQYNVFGYLLKVIKISEFIAVIDKLRIELSKNSLPEKSMKLELFFFNMLCGMYVSEKDVKKAFAECSTIPYDEAVCKVIRVKFNELDDFLRNKWHYDIDMFKNSITNIIKIEYNQSFTMMIYDSIEEYRFIILMANGENEDVDEDIIRKEFKDVFGINAKLIIDEKKYLKEFYNDNHNLFMINRERDKLHNSIDIEREDKKKHELIDKVISYIKENCTSGIQKRDIVDYFKVNSIYLSRQFKEVTGITISDMILKERMKLAIELLKQGETASNVCLMVGYNDKRNFRRLFQRHTGMTIQEYKESLKKN